MTTIHKTLLFLLFPATVLSTELKIERDTGGLRIDSYQPNLNNYKITLSYTHPETNYTLKTKTHMTNEWQELNTMNGTGSNLVFYVSSPDDKRFYRTFEERIINSQILSNKPNRRNVYGRMFKPRRI
jgi:hypothetical protein